VVENTATVWHNTLIDLTLGDTTYYLSDSWAPNTHEGQTYTALGSLLSVSGVTTQVSTSQTEVTISVGGITPDADFQEIVRNNPIRGGEVIVRRLLDDSIDNIQGGEATDDWISFRGIINTYALRETYETVVGASTLVLVLNALSIQDFLYTQYRGEITNGSDRRRYYADDVSFDNVANSYGGL
jgi:hypothetical protein